MQIQCLGVNHESAPLSILERLHLSDLQADTILSRCSCGSGSHSDPLELALLSTCNRVELYGLVRDPRQDPLAEILAESAGVNLKEIQAFTYEFSGPEAVRHLLRVSTGLDSMVIGEPQVLGQVADAYNLALRANSAGIVINQALQTAIRGGKRARAETGIGANPATMSSVAVHFAASIVKDIQASRVTVLGAGDMAELTVEALRKRGVKHVTVVNRTVARAKQLADRWNASAKSFASLAETLRETDILISSTGAPHHLIHYSLLSAAVSHRPDRPIVILDIAVPRDVEPDVAAIAAVHLYDLEDLSRHLRDSLGQREAELPAVEAIIEEELAAFEDWLQTLEVRPLIAELHQKAERIRANQVERTLARLKDLRDDDRAAIEAMSRALVKQLLHDPILQLKHASRNGSPDVSAQVVRHLFQIGATRHPFQPEDGQPDDPS